MEINSKNVLSDANNINRLSLLLTAISKLGMDVSGYGQIDVNENSGFLYVWAEDYSFTPYIDEEDTIYFMYTCGYCGEEYSMPYDENTTLETIEQWIEDSISRNDGEHCESCEETEEDEE